MLGYKQQECSETREWTEGKWTKKIGSDKEKQLVFRNETSPRFEDGQSSCEGGRDYDRVRQPNVFANNGSTVNIKSTGVLSFPAAFIFLFPSSYFI